MLRFLRDHLLPGVENRDEDLNEYFSYEKVGTHGFSQKASCLAIDEKLGLLAIGTRDGRVKIVGSEGVVWEELVEHALAIAYLYFAKGTGTLMILCDDHRTRSQAFHRCQIINDKICMTRFTPSDDDKMRLRKISCCEMLNLDNGNSALLIGNNLGDIHALRLQNLKLSTYLSFAESALASLDELRSEEQRQLDEMLTRDGNMFLAFNIPRLLILYNILNDELLMRFSLHSATNSLCYHEGAVFCPHSDGSYSALNVHPKPTTTEDSESANTSKRCPFDGVDACTPIRKLVCSSCADGQGRLLVFTGGVPLKTYGDRYTVTCDTNGDVARRVVFDFGSSVINFHLLNDDGGVASALFVLCEQELVAIDLQHPNWAPFPLPHFTALHSSPVTSTEIASNVSPMLIKRLAEVATRANSTRMERFSNRRWPLKCGRDFTNATFDAVESNSPLLFTGHENGTVNIWRSNALSWQPWVTCHTAIYFEGFESEPSALSDDGDPEDGAPLRKAGQYDPFSDDDRLAILNIHFESTLGYLTIGGRGGQAIVLELSLGSQQISGVDGHVITVDMAGGRTTQHASSNGVPLSRKDLAGGRKAVHAPLPARAAPLNIGAGYVICHGTYVQLKPAIPVSAASFCAAKNGLVAVGSEFGYCICDITSREVLLWRNLITSQEIVQLSDHGALSRFKSVHKTIRQSFRRKKRPVDEHSTIPATSPVTVNVEEFRPAEREVSQRPACPNILGGETPNSLVKVVKFFLCNLGQQQQTSDPTAYYLFVGTHGGVVLVHALADRRAGHGATTLIREIRLQHRAPVVNIEHLPQLGRILVCTEEQVRTLLLPTLRPSKFKCRFTAAEGSRVKKASILSLRKAKNAMPRNFIGLITNRGEVYLMSLTNPLRHCHVPFTAGPADAVGTSSATLSRHGDLFFLKPGGSELQRSSISAHPGFSRPSPFKDESFLPHHITAYE